MTARPAVSPKVLPATPMTCAKAKTSAARTIPAPDAERSGPTPSWRSPEEDLLAERRDDRPGEQRAARSRCSRRSGGSGLTGVTGKSADEDLPTIGTVTTMTGTAQAPRPPSAERAWPVEPPDAHLAPT